MMLSAMDLMGGGLHCYGGEEADRLFTSGAVSQLDNIAPKTPKKACRNKDACIFHVVDFLLDNKDLMCLILELMFKINTSLRWILA